MASRDEKGKILVHLARRAIEQDLGRATLERPDEAPWLDELAATFVTLEQRGELRGCIGSIQPVRSLYEDVTANARYAAFRDPRFAPLRAEELDITDIEVSLLSPTRPLEVASEQELLQKLETNVHGLVLRLGHRQATFLPSVWEMLPTPREFVTQLKRKAGIAPSEWSDEMEVLVYTVDKFIE